MISLELDALFLRFPLAVVGVDRTLNVVFANPPAQTILAPDLVQPGHAFEDGPAGGRLHALAERLATTDAPLPATIVPLVDGRMLRVNGIPADGADPAVLVLEDVTEETKYDRVMRDFLRNAAHQLRTPLTAITSAVQVLQAGAKENPADRDRFIEHVQRHTERLTRIARGLLVLARAEVGEPMRLENVELRPMLESLAAEVEPARGVAIEIDCPAELAAFCEPNLAHEALSALLDNAVEHTAEGTILLAARELEGRVLVEVHDTGPGIAAEHRDRLFEPFYRAAEAGEGFGLGLAIASQAVEAMDGDLALAESEQGTRFAIRLPSARMAT